jgi:hypothetical protein
MNTHSIYPEYNTHIRLILLYIVEFILDHSGIKLSAKSCSSKFEKRARGILLIEYGQLHYGHFLRLFN